MAEPKTASRTFAAPDASVRKTPALDPVRQAGSCLEISGRRLKRGEIAQADEVLNLLRAATAHLQAALESRDGLAPSGAE